MLMAFFIYFFFYLICLILYLFFFFFFFSSRRRHTRYWRDWSSDVCSSDLNWGYDGAHLYAPQSTYGGPEGLKKLIDACHREGLAFVLDVVYNHLGPEGNYLGEYAPAYSQSYTTPWGAALNYDDAESDGMRRHFASNALYWLHEYHVDALRLDAVHQIFDKGPRHLLQEIATSF